MSLRLLFWVIMLLWLIFGILSNWGHWAWGTSSGWILEFVLFAILGWRVFGPPIRDDA